MSNNIPMIKPNSTRYPTRFSMRLIHFLSNKNKADKKFLKSGLDRDYRCFSVLRRSVKLLLAQNRKYFFFRCEEGLRNDPTNFGNLSPIPLKRRIAYQLCFSKENLSWFPLKFARISQSIFHQFRKHLWMTSILTSKRLVILAVLMLAFLWHLCLKLSLLSIAWSPESRFDSAFYCERS